MDEAGIVIEEALGRYAGLIGPSETRLGVARNSTDTGFQGLRQAAQDAVLLVDQMARLGLGDYRERIPSEADIIRRLKDSTDVMFIGGRKWRYYVFICPGLFLIICAGSGTKTDDRGIQPFMERVRDTILSLRPKIVFARELDRLGRDELGLGQIVRAVEAVSGPDLDCFLASGDRGLLPKYPGWDVGLYFEGRQARTQAESLARRTGDTKVLQTGRDMVGGRFTYPLSPAVPAGLARVRLRDARGAKGPVMAFLDSPTFRPSSVEVFEPLHDVRDDRGQPADQVKCIRWALVEMANGRPATEIASVLLSMGFSTDQLRRHSGRDASYRSVYGSYPARRATGLCHRLAGHIDFYDSGVLRRTVRGTLIEVRNVLPPGGWVSEEVADAVRLWRVSRQRTGTHLAKSAFGGLRVTVNGVEAAMGLVSPSCSCRLGCEG